MELLVFLSGIVAGVLIAWIVQRAVYLFTRKRGQHVRTHDEFLLSSSISSVAEDATPVILVDNETGKKFSYVPSSANHLGSGGYGFVYKGWCLQSHTNVAIKLISTRRYGNDERALKYFKREVETLKVGSRASRNVTMFFGSVTDDALCTLVTEYCDGGDMSRWMEDAFIASMSQHLRLAIFLQAYIQLANGLLGLRESQIIHRDLKRTNVFVTSTSGNFARASISAPQYPDMDGELHRAEVPFTVKIGDFGLARLLSDSEELTAGIGTEGYMAPEVRRGGTYGTQSDLYSLGVMLRKDLESTGLYNWLANWPLKWHSDSMRVMLSLTNADPTERPTLETLIATLKNFTLEEYLNYPFSLAFWYAGA